MSCRHVYVHVPFCARRCSYCDFAIAVRRETPVDDYLRALRAEIALRGSRGEVDTIYFGGGTPSRLGAKGVETALAIVLDAHPPASGAEITIEANPDDVTRDNARAWRAAGVNRLSIGVQSFDDDALRWMHRTHDAAAIPRAFDAARAAGFDNLSLDLIFALPRALERDWGRDLERALALEPEHVSLYGLTVEPFTPLGRWRERGAVIESPEESYEAEYLEAHDFLTRAGFEHYEVSNFGRPGRGSRHNAVYWSGAAYGGYGPSAHRFDGSTRAWNVRAYADWARRAAAGRDPTEDSETLSPEQESLERAYLELRTSNGVRSDDVSVTLQRAWIDAGWALRASGRLSLTPAGWLRLDALAASLTDSGSPCNV